jgi:hypothetical protein
MKFNLATFSMLAYGVTAISLFSVNSNSAFEGFERGVNIEGSVDSQLAQNFYEDENVRDLSQTYSNLNSESSLMKKNAKSGLKKKAMKGKNGKRSRSATTINIATSASKGKTNPNTFIIAFILNQKLQKR